MAPITGLYDIQYMETSHQFPYTRGNHKHVWLNRIAKWSPGMVVGGGSLGVQVGGGPRARALHYNTYSELH